MSAPVLSFCAATVVSMPVLEQQWLALCCSSGKPIAHLAGHLLNCSQHLRLANLTRGIRVSGGTLRHQGRLQPQSAQIIRNYWPAAASAMQLMGSIGKRGASQKQQQAECNSEQHWQSICNLASAVEGAMQPSSIAGVVQPNRSSSKNDATQQQQQW